MTTVEALAEFLGIDLAATSKAMPVTTEDGTRRARAHPRRRPAEESKLARGARGSARVRRRTRRSAPRSAPSGGSLGPVGFEGEVVADLTLRDGQFVAGANRDGWHLRGVEAGRDYEPEFADLREPIEGDRCPECGGALAFQTAIEVGHIFKFGDKYSRAARRDVPRRGREGEAAAGRQLRHRAGARARGGRRAVPRRARDRLAARRSRRTTSMSSRSRAPRRSASRRPQALSAGGARRAPRRPRPAGRARSSPTPT